MHIEPPGDSKNQKSIAQDIVPADRLKSQTKIGHSVAIGLKWSIVIRSNGCPNFVLKH